MHFDILKKGYFKGSPCTKGIMLTVFNEMDNFGKIARNKSTR